MHAIRRVVPRGRLPGADAQLTPLFLRGYSVIPTPQKVVFQGGEMRFDGAWRLEAGALAKHIAARTLVADLKSMHSLELGSGPGKPVRLAIVKDAVAVKGDPELSEQAYRLRLTPQAIEITGNSGAGLFYGVQTFLQLLKRAPDGSFELPVASIEDWPRLALRFLHWDTKHHQDRMETIKRYLDWSARFKANMIGFELEDKFAYPSNPAIGAPGAFTPAQLQEIVDYGLERFIQVVPVIQAPAHMAYVLKHPQYARLRADGNNYQSCLCLEDTYKLIFRMYDDVIAATKGVKYLYVSTDEIYYAGIGANCKEPYNPVNRSLKWAEFARRARDHAASRGRRILAWLEYPLLTEHLERLPSDIIDGVIGEEDYVPVENKKGMRQLAYVSLQGAEFLFPDHFNSGDSAGRLQQTYSAIAQGRHWKANPMGVFGAAWDDSGLHSETFWLGWSAAARWGWNPGTPGVEQHAAEFMNVYYGPRVTGMVEIYRSLQRQARSWQRTWDRVTSRVRAPGYGNSYAKGRGAERTDLTLEPPAKPQPADLALGPRFVPKYTDFLAEARARSGENDQLLHALAANFLRAERNRYNLEVFDALARFIGHHWDLLAGMADAERALGRASESAKKNDARRAVGEMVRAYNTVQRLDREGAERFAHLTAVFEKSRFPKGREVNGRKFVHVLDDTKDHWADRTPDLGYMQAPERSIGLDAWRKELYGVLQTYAKKNSVPIRGLAEARLEE
ncbi:MAG: beta-N-acetylhexosaminidase [Acidobacteria bacterium]|nr:beta-N-acetylhexosaminidase [Acidobacteriota bacterium]